MSVAIDTDRIALAGHATVEDAELLLAALLDHPDHAVDISGLSRAHLSVVQLLHAAGRPLIGRPENAFLDELALPGLITTNDI